MFKFQSNKKFSKIPKAFSLVELSIVILIASILVTGAITVSSSLSDKERIKISRDRINAIYQAIGNYVVINKRLPCPAASTLIKSSSSSYGLEAGSAGACTATGVTNSTGTLYFGMVPAKTLGLSADLASDGFDNKIGYMVNQSVTTTAGFATATAPGTEITVNETLTSGSLTDITTADFALVSFGKNGSGAYGMNSSSQNTASGDADELENSQSSANVTLIARSEISDVFDDIVFFKTRNQILLDFNIINLISCAGYSETLYGTTITWPAASYGQTAISTVACPAGYIKGPNAYPTRRCDALGVWGPIINPCLN